MAPAPLPPPVDPPVAVPPRPRGEFADGALAPRPRTGPARRDGVIVPLRVPWRTKLKAGAGLMVMVAFLGAGTALLVAAVALAFIQALGKV